MRTAQICPTCATYTNAVCVIYNGSYLANIGVSPLDSLEKALININSSIVTSTGTGNPTASPTYLGQFYVNTTTGVIYYATSLGLGPASWTIIGLGLGFTAENVVNKTTSASDIIAFGTSITKYPSVKSIKDYVDQSIINIDLQTVLNNGHTLVDGINPQGTDAGGGLLFVGTNINAFGDSSAYDNIGSDINAMGDLSAYNNEGSNVNAFGSQAGNVNKGSGVNALGNGAATGNEGDKVNALGEASAVSNKGNNINAFGLSAAANNTITGNNVNAFGDNAAQGNTEANVNAFGSYAGQGNTHANVNLFGNAASATGDSQVVFTNTSNKFARITYDSLTADQLYTLPNASGTIALQSYKSLAGTITQSGTSAPTMNIFLNEMTDPVTFRYLGTGQYAIDCLDFTSKTIVFIQLCGGFGGTTQACGSSTIVSILTQYNNVATNGLLDQASIEIRVYP